MSYFATNTVRSNEPLSIQRRRLDETNKAALHNVIAEQKQRENIANWENTVTQKQSYNITKALVNTVRQQQAGVLQYRRQRLSELLTNEDEQYRHELHNQQQSTEDRLNTKLAIARQLKQEREERRQQYVRQQYELLYQLNCDELRTIDSQHYTKYIAGQQRQQVEHNTALRAQQHQDDRRWQQQYEAERLEKVRRDGEMVQRRKQALVDNRATITQQLAEKEALKQQQQQRIQADKQAMNARIESDNQAAAVEAAQVAERNAMLRRQIAAYNERLEAERQGELRQRKQAERDEINMKIEQYKADTAAKNEHARALYNDMNAYRQYLQQQKIEQQAAERQIEQMVQADMDRYYQQRDAQYAREKAAREALLSDVLQQRGQQVAEKEVERQGRVSEQQRLQQQYESEMVAQKQAEQAELVNKYNRMLARKAELQQQMDELKARRMGETNEVMRQRQAVRDAEVEYETLLDKMRRTTIDNAQKQYGAK